MFLHKRGCVAAAAALLSVAVMASPPSTNAASIDLGAASGFTVLGLNNGSVIINSATSITGDVGYSDGVVSGTNQKVDAFNGTARVHSAVDTFTPTLATFQPSGGIVTDPANDTLLNQANTDAAAASSFLAGLIPTQNLGNIGDDDSFSVGAGVYTIGSFNFKEDTITLTGSATDEFIFNVSGSFDFANSEIVLQGGAIAANVIFNFLNNVDILIKKDGTVFNGTILALTGNVEYHNPATFNGRIIAKDINLHSDFNINGPSTTTVIPVPAALPLMATAVAAFALIARRRRVGPPQA